MIKLPALIDWKALKRLIGHPYSRQHTHRLMSDPILPFPRPRHLQDAPPGTVNRSRALWRTRDVINWYAAKGIVLDVDIETP